MNDKKNEQLSFIVEEKEVNGKQVVKHLRVSYKVKSGSLTSLVSIFLPGFLVA